MFKYQQILKNKLVKNLFFTFVLFVINNTFVFAATDAGGASGGNNGSVANKVSTDIAASINSLKFFQSDIGVFITRSIEISLMVGSILVFAYLAWGAIDWITSGGDKGKAESARNKITAALLGLTILASAWALWLLANYFLGTDKLIKINKGGSGSGTGTAAGNSGPGYLDCCPNLGTSSACCDYMQSKGDYYVLGRYQNEALYCDQTYINWGLWQQDWQTNVGNPGDQANDACAPK